MKQIGSQTRELIEESDMTPLAVDTIAGEAILIDRVTGNLESWIRNDHFAGYVIEINGEGYEFASSLTV